MLPGGGDLLRMELGDSHAALGHDHRDHHHSGTIDRVSLRMDRTLDRGRFMARLQRLVLEQGQDLLRAKGIVDLAGAAKKFVFQGVHVMMDTELTQPWAEGECRQSRLVFIGRHLDGRAMRDELGHCAA